MEPVTQNDSNFWNVIKRIPSTIEKVPYFVLFLVVFSLCYLNFTPNSNEEQYLQLAKQFMDPSWISNATSLTEFAGTRLIYQVLLGSVLKFMSFGATTLLFRAILIVVLSWILAGIYRCLNLSKLQALFHLCALYLAHQALFAGAWMFITVEPKGFAYPIVLCAVLCFFKKKPWKGTLLLIAATYVHVLVGFYTAFYLFVALLFIQKENRNNFKSVVIQGITYLLTLIPLIIYVKSAVAFIPNVELPSPDWIYTYYRSPHHTALFKTPRYFLEHHLFGVLLTFLAGMFLYFVPKKGNYPFLLSRHFVLASITGTLIFVLIALVDKQGVLLKYYPFRIMAMSTFFMGACILSVLCNSIKEQQRPVFKFGLVLLAFYGLIQLAIPNVLANKHAVLSQDPLEEACDFIKEESKPDLRIFSFVGNASVTRLTERDRYAVNKFIPAEFAKVQDWYIRDQKRQELMNESENLHQFCSEENIEFVLALSKSKLPIGFVSVFENEKYTVYKWIALQKQL